MVRDESLQLSILEHCRNEFTGITPLIDAAAPKTSLYRCKDDLVRDGLLKTDGKDRYMTSAEGLLRIAALKGEAPKGLTILYPPLAYVPTPQHRAAIELSIAAVIARKFNLREDRHPTVILMGPTLTWKTSTGTFLCQMLGLDATTQIVNLAAESGRSLWLRKTSTGAIAYKRELLDTPLVVFDEYQLADSESRRLLRIWMDGRKNVAVDNEKLTIEAVPLITLNPSNGEKLEDRLGISDAQLRRSITCDLTGIRLPNLAIRGEGIIVAAKSQLPLKLVKPQYDLTKYKPKLYELFTATLNNDGQQLADLETLVMLSTAMTAYFNPIEAIRLVFFDALLLFETLGWSKPGWAVHVRNFPTGTYPTAESSDPKSIPEETWADAFKFLDEGGSPTELVIKYHLNPETALHIAKKHNELKATDERKSTQTDSPADPDALKLEKEVKLAQLRRQKSEQEKPFEIDKKIGDLLLTITHLKTTINDQGSWKKDHCNHFQDNYCRNWQWSTKPALPYQIGEPLLKDGRWYINPDQIRCATCPMYRERGIFLSIHDVYRQALSTKSQVSTMNKGLVRTPVYNLRNRFQCSNCQTKGLVAVKIHCTNCQAEQWWGFHPEKKK